MTPLSMAVNGSETRPEGSPQARDVPKKQELYLVGTVQETAQERK